MKIKYELQSNFFGKTRKVAWIEPENIEEYKLLEKIQKGKVSINFTGVDKNILIITDDNI